MDRARGLVNMSAGDLEVCRIPRRGLESAERVDASGERLIDFALHPGKRAEVEFGSGIYGHAFSDRTIALIRSKKYAGRKADRSTLGPDTRL